MTVWKVDDRLETQLTGLRDATLRIVGGDVVVAAGGAEPSLEVERHAGPPVDVIFEDGILQVRQGTPESGGVLGFLGRFLGDDAETRATVVLRCPPDTRLELGAVTAAVVVTGSTGDLGVKAVSGDVTLKDIRGRTDVKTVSGDVDAIGVSGPLGLKTVSGSVSLLDGSCPSVEAKSVSGDFVLDLDLAPDGVYAFKTVSGLVALRTSPDPSVEVEVTTMSGGVVSDFGVVWTNDRPGQRTLRHTIGDGEARLTVKTVSGELRLLRRKVAAA